MLYARGVPLDACFDVLNLHDPKTVQSIHREYVAAGADLIETNTFGANRFKLAVHGLDGRVREINRAGARLARDVRETMGKDVLVLGSIGPLGKYLLPLGTLGEAEASAAFREQAEGLLEGGVDGFVAETFSDLRELRLAVEAIRAVSADLPIVAQMAFNDEHVTFLGQAPSEVARELAALPVQVIGANCSVGSSVLYDVGLLFHEAAPRSWLSIRPNAGLPFAPVAETASGGELSRIALAIAAVGGGETMVFDEIDAGIGGQTAHAVGETLRRLAERAQVVTITHLPQIASLADRHFRVEKVPGDPTHTTIEQLGDDERREELQRMLGGEQFIAAVQQER